MTHEPEEMFEFAALIEPVILRLCGDDIDKAAAVVQAEIDRTSADLWLHVLELLELRKQAATKSEAMPLFPAHKDTGPDDGDIPF